MTVIQNQSDQSDSDLLQEFAAQRSQAAFTELVSRHSNWVYSAATRMVRDPHLAEDVAQAIFLVMADKAGSIANVPLHRWLFKVTRYASANAIRARSRRDKYERLAAMSSSEIQPDPEKLWQEVSPVLDDSINRLRSADRDALILRFYQQKSVAEVGAALGVSEGAAKIRILRAVDKLRGLLRRRGVTTSADALRAAMLIRVTHPAPASIAKIAVPAAATIKATAISKGVTAMMISTKAKVAAIVILLASIPIGAGAIYMATTSSDHAAVAPQSASQVATDQIPQDAAAPTSPAAPAPVEQTFGFDPRVAPFITNRTDIIIVLDLSKIDLDVLAADMQTELAKMQLPAPAAAQLNGMLQMGDGAGKMWINGFKQAGGTTMYMLSRADELIVGGTSNAPSLRMTATLVYPTDSPEAALTLAKYLTSPGARPPKVIGSTVVDRSSNTYIPPTQVQTDPRPALAAGLLAAGDSPLRATANPLRLKEIMPKLMASGKIPMKFGGTEWDGVEYFSMKVVLPPAESPSLSWVSHHKDSATAATAEKNATQRIADLLKSEAQTNSPLETQMRKFVATEKFTVNGPDVYGTMDLHAYWRLIFSAILSAHQPPSTQQQAHPL